MSCESVLIALFADAGYAIYLFHAGMLHGCRYFTDEVKSPIRLWRSCVVTLLYVAVMSCFTVV